MFSKTEFGKRDLGSAFVIAGWAALAALLLACSAFADGMISLESTGFLRRSPDRANSSTTLIMGPELESKGKWLEAEVDVKGVTFLSDRSSFTVESGNTFLSTSSRWSSLHQLTLGRRKFDWSQVDRTWSYGLWSNRFLWNPLRPEEVGLTGLFYKYESKSWRFLAYGSPISIPERGFPVRQDSGGRLVSPSADWVPPYEQMQMMNQRFDIRYSLEVPPVTDLIAKPGGAMQLRYGEKTGAWASAGYALMPMHQLNLAAEVALVPKDDGWVEARIHPEALYHHLGTFETGFQSEDWGVWGSVTREQPLTHSYPANWVVDPIGPAWIGVLGAQYSWSRRWISHVSFIRVAEEKPALAPDQLTIDFPSRFPFTKAVQVGLRGGVISRLVADAQWKYDIDQLSHLISTDLEYRFSHATQGWLIGVGADAFITSTGRGFIGQYEGNDRIRARISYAF